MGSKERNKLGHEGWNQKAQEATRGPKKVKDLKARSLIA
jgi:hypothetical protein